MEEIEVWKSLDFMNYPEYEVSNMGRVKSLKRTIIKNNGKKQTFSERILKPNKNIWGYLLAQLWKDGKGKNFSIHKLVALAFIKNDNPTEKTEINHLDENKENNHVSNLCWCSHIENINYGTRNERAGKNSSKTLKGKYVGENHPMFGKKHSEESKKKISKANKGKKRSEETKQKLSIVNKGKRNKPMLQFTLDNIFIREWCSATSASTELKINRQNITACCRGKRNQCGGYKWVYKSEYYKPTYIQLELQFDYNML